MLFFSLLIYTVLLAEKEEGKRMGAMVNLISCKPLIRRLLTTGDFLIGRSSMPVLTTLIVKEGWLLKGRSCKQIKPCVSWWRCSAEGSHHLMNLFYPHCPFL